MIFGLLGDLHLSRRSPEKRTDSNYFMTLLDKLDQALSVCDQHHCDYILQVGDFFNSPMVGNYVVSTIIRKLNSYRSKFTVCAVAGQHDMVGHSRSTLSNSPIAVLEAANVIRILGAEPYSLNEADVHLYGASFGESVPEPADKCYNVLVTHRMIGNRPLYPGQELEGPRQFLRRHTGYDLVVCGDYHYRFIDSYDKKVIINPGALVRKTVSEFDLEHKPAVVIFDTDTRSCDVIELKVKPIEEVFDFAKTEKKRDNAILLQFIEGLRDHEQKFDGWKHILLKVLKEKNAGKEVSDIINQCLEEIKSSGAKA